MLLHCVIRVLSPTNSFHLYRELNVKRYDCYFFLSYVPFIVENITLPYKCKPTISSGLTKENEICWMLEKYWIYWKLRHSPKCHVVLRDFQILNMHNSSLYVPTLELYLPHKMWLYLKIIGIICCQPSIHYFFFLPNKTLLYSGIYPHRTEKIILIPVLGDLNLSKLIKAVPPLLLLVIGFRLVE